MKIKGRVWKFGDNVDTDQIIPAEYLVTADKNELAKHAFEKVMPEFAKNVKENDIIVAGKNFGCGSSREHAPLALLGCKISCVIAESFARIFYRNSINLGLKLIECKIDADNGDILEIDFDIGEIKNLNTNKIFKFNKFPEFFEKLSEIGLIEYTKKRLKMKKFTEESTLEDLLKGGVPMELLYKYGVPCIACPMAQFEMSMLKLKDIKNFYGVDIDSLLKEINKE